MTPLETLYEDPYYLIVNKPATVLSQGNGQELGVLETLQGTHEQKLHLRSRLDRPVSGCLLMTKQTDAAAKFKKYIQKSYIAVIEKKVEIPKTASLTHWLSKFSKTNKAHISEQEKEGWRKVELDYEILAELDNYYIVLVKPKTGRFHQIRAQMAHLGNPIKGDVKYGARRKNKDRSIHLHCRAIDLGKESPERIICPYPSTDALWELAQANTKSIGL